MHPKVKAFYDETKLEYLESVQDKLEKQFEKMTSLSRQENKAVVEKIYRFKQGGTKSHEYCWYTLKISGKDRKGNYVSVDKTVGKYEMPRAQYNFDDEANPEVIGVNDIRTEYELQWSPKIMDELEEKGLISDATQCYVNNGSRGYGQFFVEQFRTADFEDLVHLGQTGHYPTPEQKAILAGPPSTRMGQPVKSGP